MITVKGKVGKRVELMYPVVNRLGVPLEYLERYVVIESVRSIADEPLSLESFLMRPFLRRGVTLINGIEEGKRRRFYLECCKGGREPGLQFVVVDANEPFDSLEPIGRVFAPTKAERQRMLEVLPEYDSLPPNLSLCVRAVE